MIEWLLRKAGTAARAFGPDGTGPREPAATWLRAETAHWVGALRMAHAAGRHADVLDLATSMHWYSDQRGDGDLWHEVFGYGVGAARASGSRRDEAVQLNFLCWTLCVMLDQPDDALAVHHEAWVAAIDSGDVMEQGWALYYRSAAERRLGRLVESRECATRAVELFEAAGSPLAAQLARSNLGIVLNALGRYVEAVEVHRQCVAYHRSGTAAHDKETVAVNLLRLGVNLIALREWDEAQEVCTEALRLSRAAQARNSEAEALHRLGMILHGRGEAAGAVTLLQDAVALTSDHRTTTAVQVLGLLASVHDELGNADEARACRLRALDMCSRSQTPAVRQLGEALLRALRA